MDKILKSEIDAALELCDDFTYEEEIETVGNSFLTGFISVQEF